MSAARTRIDVAEVFRRSGMAPKSILKYIEKWAPFEVDCDARGEPSLPTTDAVVAEYLRSIERTVELTGIIQSRAAIGKAHQLAGYPWNKYAPLTSAAVNQIKRRRGVGHRFAKELLTEKQTREIIKDTDRRTEKGLRDCAVILLIRATGLRRAQIAALCIADVEPAPDGYRITVRHVTSVRSGRQLVQNSVRIKSAKDKSLCPVRALRSWLGIRSSLVVDGSLFQSLGPRSGFTRLRAPEVTKLIQDAIAGAKLDPTQYGAESLREPATCPECGRRRTGRRS